MTRYLDILNLREFPARIRRTIAGEYVPALLNALAEKGLTVDCGHDLSAIARLQARHPDKSLRLYELANPAHYPTTSLADTFVLRLVSLKTGEDIGCVAGRLRWFESSVAAGFTSKRALLDAPSDAGGEYLISNEWAKRHGDFHAAMTTGLTVLPGHPGAMKGGLRLLNLWMLSEWQFQYYIALAPERIAYQYSLDVEGYSAIRKGVMWKRPTVLHPDGVWTEYCLVTAEREHWRQIAQSPRIADLSAPLARPEPPLVIEHRREAAE